MSLNRIALRLAVVEAAANFFREDQPWPTLAGPNIFDSRINPSEQLEDGVAVPIVVVYTDYDKDSWGFRRKGQDHRMLNLTLELLMVQKVEAADSSETYTIGTPTTDAELEVSLDMLELQIYRALREGGSTAGECFLFLVQSFENLISRRGASVENGQRVAARQITIEMDVLRDPNPGVLPEPVRAFLDEVIEADNGTAEQARLVRSEYLRAPNSPFSNPAALQMELTRSVGDALGFARRGAPVLPPVVRWLDEHGRPLR